MILLQALRLPACLGLIQLATFGLLPNARAGSATWSASPATGNWKTATNWNPNTIPNSSSDTATFSFSEITNVGVTGKISLNGIAFDPGASPYMITDSAPATMTISGTGISNNSGTEQHLQIDPVAEIDLSNSATIAGPTVIDVIGSPIMFGEDAGLLFFADTASAGEATIISGTTNSTYPAVTQFRDSSTAGNAVITSRGGTSVDQRFGGVIVFEKASTAANATLACEGAAVSPGSGGHCYFFDNSNAGSATITANGGTVSGAVGGYVQFFSSATANSTLIANGGINGGAGGSIVIDNAGAGAQPRVELFGNGSLSIIFPVTIGSVEGDGLLYLGGSNLTVGANGLSTLFSGVIQDGGFSMLTGGSLTKTGTGTLTLTGESLYTGGTTVSQGTLVVSNQSGSGTGTAAVLVSAGTLGGSGTVSGAVTVGTGSGTGAFLAPAAGTNRQATFTTQSSLTFQADATYTYTAKAKGRKARTDKTVANGVTINGAAFSFQPRVQGALQAGLVFTVIDNTAATPITGIFSNLPDGAIITAGGANFQATYEGGDGNDLTLTVQ